MTNFLRSANVQRHGVDRGRTALRRYPRLAAVALFASLVAVAATPAIASVRDANRWAVLARSSDPDVRHGLELDRGDNARQAPAQAVTWYRRAAQRGVPAGEWALGDMYWNGRGVPRDYAQAAALFESAAALNFARAQEALGEAYDYGRGKPMDHLRAGALYRQAADAGDPVGEYFVGTAYAGGSRGLRRDDARAVYWLRRAAAQADHWAEEYLASMLLSGKGASRDPATALVLLQRSAAGGFGDAMGLLADMYASGRSVAVDTAQAQRWRVSAFKTYTSGAQDGDPYAEGKLAIYYHRGWGMARDDAMMWRWLRDPVAQNNPGAEITEAVAYSLGWGTRRDGAASLRAFQRYESQGWPGGMYLVGLCYTTCPGIENYPKAIALFQRAAAMGDADAMVMLADSYESGTGVAKNEQVALQYYTRAAALHNSDGAEGVGNMYWSGEVGGHPDYATALKWYREAAELGSTSAMIDIGDAYYFGHGVPAVDYKIATSWYQRAADAGNNAALFDLGYMYRWGKGVPEDVPKALTLYRQAAEGGSSAAQDALGLEYESGSDAVTPDARQAETWYRRAADAGNADAQWRLGKMLSGATGEPPDYIESAKWLSLAIATTDNEETKSNSSNLLAEVLQRLDDDARAEVAFQLRRWAYGHGLTLSFGRSSAMPGIHGLISAIAQASRSQHSVQSLEKVAK